MPLFTDRSRASLVATTVLVLLLVVLGTLQYRWLGQVAEAERARARASLAAAAARFAADFDLEIGDIAACFVPAASPGMSVPARLVARYDCAVSRSGRARLIAEVDYVERRSSGETAFFRLDPISRRLDALDWPASLVTLRNRLERGPDSASPGFGGRRRFEAIDGDLPGLVLPEVPEGVVGSRDAFETADVVLVRLDPAYLRGTLFPDLARRHFGSGRLENYDVTILRRGDPAHPLYVDHPGAAGSPVGDATADLLTLRIFEDARRFGMERGAHTPGRPGSGTGGPDRLRLRPRLGAGDGQRLFPGPWRVVVAHRGGSLNAEVARARRRNIAVAFGILAILAVSGAMLIVSTRHAQLLARQQIDFVTSVTHELNTPLAAIRSAGQNLADGVVSDGEHVRRYGSLIESEGRRLSEMVTRVLDFAGIQTGLRSYRMRPLSVGAVVDTVLARCRLAAEERGIRVERQVAADLPPILADEEAFGRALGNLVDNAIKYGGGQRWLRVLAWLAADGSRPEVAIAVEDRGPGIRPSERRSIFQPFYRGAGPAAEGVAGSGLGLALVRPIVEAHGGTITVESNDGGVGARFTIRLPVAFAAGSGEIPAS